MIEIRQGDTAITIAIFQNIHIKIKNRSLPSKVDRGLTGGSDILKGQESGAGVEPGTVITCISRLAPSPRMEMDCDGRTLDTVVGHCEHFGLCGQPLTKIAVLRAVMMQCND